MKIGLLSDPHLTVTTPIGRTDNIATAMAGKMWQVEQVLIQHQIQHLLIAGDLTDVKRSWDLLSYLTALFKRWKQDNGIQIYSVFGQHDSYYHEVQNESTVLGILIKSGLVTRLGKKRILIGENYKRAIALYGSSWGEDIPRCTDTTLNILVIHRMIAMGKLWAKQTNLIYAPDFLREHDGYQLILCGDAHRSFIHRDGNDRRIICNTGPLLRLEASKDMMRHIPKVMIYDTDLNTVRPVLLDVDHEVFTRDHIKDVKQEREEFDAFVNEILAQGTSRYSFEHILRSYLAALDEKGEGPSKNVRKILSEVMADE